MRAGGRRTLLRRARQLAAVFAVVLAVRLAHVVVPGAPLSERVPSGHAVQDRQGRLLRLTLADDQAYRLWTPLAGISPTLIEATLLYEDRLYRWHFGVNPASIARAAWVTATGGRRIGGSTITMQLARRLWGIRSRTAWGKAKQIGAAMLLELIYSKDEILEAYLNLVPYGRNIEGVGAASLVYFGKPADRLLLNEALTLAVIPQNPTARALADGSGEALARAQLWGRWEARHPEAKRDEALGRLPMPMRDLNRLPFLAPHFTETVLAARPATAVVRTTLDLRLQRLVERHARAYVARRSREGIRNAVVMLVDHRDMEVKALLGSVDWRSAEIGGQVNGALARRSPGSALKPFIYALGLEQGVIHPSTVLKDAPVVFASYSPENFDGRYVGPISAREALWRSRNIPALTLAAQLSKPSFYQFLKTAGISRLRPEEHYGLSLVLGGAEVSMEELVTLYAALANGGRLRPVRYLPLPSASEEPAAGARVLGEESSFLVLDMLRDNPRPDRADGETREREVAWKTGTSYGFRDAWAVGVFGPYVLAVWIGDFSGAGNPAYVGVLAAAPLFFEIVDSIQAQGRSVAQTVVPRGVSRVEVCAVSGELPGPHCKRKRTTWFIPGRSPIGTCEVHRPVEIDDASGGRACPGRGGRGGEKTHVEVFEFWPSDMLILFARAGLPRRRPPPPAPGCAAATEDAAAIGTPPRITSPLRGVTYTLQQGGRESVPLQAVADAAARELYWFIDDSFVGRARVGSALLHPARPGTYTVRVVDDLGLADAREMKVERAQ